MKIFSCSRDIQPWQWRSNVNDKGLHFDGGMYGLESTQKYETKRERKDGEEDRYGQLENFLCYA
jgi:hypothetical protein